MIKPGQPRKWKGKNTEIRVVLPEDWKEEDYAEAERLGIVSARSGNPQVAELYRRMRALWYATPKKVRDQITYDTDGY